MVVIYGSPPSFPWSFPHQVVVSAPALKQVDLLSVTGFLLFVNETHDCSVVCKLNGHVVIVPWHTVMGQQRVQQWTEHTSLGGSCTQCDGFGCFSQHRLTVVAPTGSPVSSDRGWSLGPGGDVSPSVSAA